MGQSVVIIGRPGTGKSTLLRWLLRQVQSVIVYDSKWDPSEWVDEPDYIITEDISDLSRYERVILRCPSSWLHDRKSWELLDHPWALALEHPMQRQSTVAAFDEALSTWPVEGGHPGTHRLIQQGRSFRVTTVVGSQLANNIDTRLLRMANQIFVLGPCKNNTELDCIFKACRVDTAPLALLKKHQIAWWQEDKDYWTIFKPLKINKPSRLRMRLINSKRPRIIIGLLLAVAFFGRSLGPISILLFSGASYLAMRRQLSAYWRVRIQSKEWETTQAEIIPLPNEGKKRVSAKSFRI